MHSDVRKFIRQCSNCQQIKYEPKRPAGLLQPLPIPASPWEDLSLDFISGLPPSQGYTTILVVVDHFTKGSHFGALAPTYIAHKVATFFSQHGLQALWLPSKFSFRPRSHLCWTLLVWTIHHIWHRIMHEHFLSSRNRWANRSSKSYIRTIS